MCPDKQPKWGLLTALCAFVVAIVVFCVAVVGTLKTAHGAQSPHVKIEIYAADETGTTKLERAPVSALAPVGGSDKPLARDSSGTIDEDRAIELLEQQRGNLKATDNIGDEESTGVGGAGSD